jgi:hypothetical protein
MIPEDEHLPWIRDLKQSEERIVKAIYAAQRTIQTAIQGAETDACQRRSRIPQKRRLKIPQ